MDELANATAPESAGAGTEDVRRASLLRYSPALVLVAASIIDAVRLAGPDLWGHVRFGQMFLAAGRYPSTDPFNYSVPNHVWLHHEWLTQVMMGWLYEHWGVIGLKLLKFTCSAGTAVFLASALAETGATISIQLAALLLASLALVFGMQFRPQMFDFVSFSALIWVLERDNFRRESRLWLLIPILILWSNFHGGFFMGLLAISVYGAATGLRDLRARRGLKHGVRIFAFASAGTLGTLANPLGLEVWRAIAVTLFNPISHLVMADFRPLSVVAMSGAGGAVEWWASFAILLIFAFGVLLLLAPAAGDAGMAAIGVLMSIAALAAVRNVGFAAIAIAPPLARRMTLLYSRYHLGRQTPALAPPRSLAREAAVALLAISMLAGGGLFSPDLRDDGNYPDSAIAFIRSHSLRGNILNQFEWGQYLIWHIAPKCRIFIDGRFDLVYPRAVVMDYLDLYGTDDRALRTLSRYSHDFVLVRSDSSASAFMKRQSGWKLIYRDETATLFARADSDAAQIPGLPVIGHATSGRFP